jgi:osmotically-inducible protein OsmY
MTDSPPHRLAARIKDRLAADARTVELGIDVDIHDGVIILRGQVATARRRALIEAVAREAASGLRIANDVIVVGLPPQTKYRDGGTPWSPGP